MLILPCAYGSTCRQSRCAVSGQPGRLGRQQHTREGRRREEGRDIRGCSRCGEEEEGPGRGSSSPEGTDHTDGGGRRSSRVGQEHSEHPGEERRQGRDLGAAGAEGIRCPSWESRIWDHARRAVQEEGGRRMQSLWGPGWTEALRRQTWRDAGLVGAARKMFLGDPRGDIAEDGHDGIGRLPSNAGGLGGHCRERDRTGRRSQRGENSR